MIIIDTLPNTAASMSKVGATTITIIIIVTIVGITIIIIGQAPKIYPIHLLMTSNYRLPNDADR